MTPDKTEKSEKVEKIEKAEKTDVKTDKMDRQGEKKKKKILLRELEDMHREVEEMKANLAAKTSSFERLQEQWWQNVGVDMNSEGHLRMIQAASACANASLGLGDNLRIMLAHGADIMLPSSQNGRTALHCAASAGHARVVSFLIDSGAQLESKDLDGKTAFDLAASSRRFGIVQLLDEARAFQSFKAIEKEYKLSEYISSGDERLLSQKVEKVAIQRQLSRISGAKVSSKPARFFGETVTLKDEKLLKAKKKDSSSSTPLLFSTGNSIHALPTTGRSTPAMIQKGPDGMPLIHSGAGGVGAKGSSLIHSTPSNLGKHGHPTTTAAGHKDTKEPKKDKDHAYHQSTQKSSGDLSARISDSNNGTSAPTSTTGSAVVSGAVAEGVEGVSAAAKERKSRRRDKGAIRRLIDWTKGRNTVEGEGSSATPTTSEDNTDDEASAPTNSSRSGGTSQGPSQSSSPLTSHRSNRSSPHITAHHQPRTPRPVVPGAGVAFGVAFGRMRGSCQSPNCHCTCFSIDPATPSVLICTCRHFPATHEDLGEANNLVVEGSSQLHRNILEGLEHLNITDEKDLQVLVEKEAGVAWPKILNPALEDDMVAQLFSGVFTREDLIVPSHDIEFLKKLGQGASATVYLGIHKSRGTRLAIKVIDMFPTGSKSLAKIQYEMTEELRVMSALSEVSDYVVRFYGVISQPRLCILLEFCSHGTMTDVLQNKNIRLDWPLYFKWAREIVHGIYDLHNWSPPIVHRDLKTLNLLVDDQWRVKVADFGLSRFLAPEESQTTLGKMRGTYAYTDPEIYDGIKFSPKADMYSLGIILWELTYRTMKGEYLRPYGEYPFMVRDYQIIIQVARKDLRPTIPDRTPAPIADIIRSLWAKKPANPRPTASQLLEMFEHLETQVYANAKAEWDSALPPIPSDVARDSVIYIDHTETQSTATPNASVHFGGGPSSLSTSDGSSWSGLAHSSSAENLSSSSSARPSPRVGMTPVTALALSGISTSSPRGMSSQSSPSSSPSSLAQVHHGKESASTHGSSKLNVSESAHHHLLVPTITSARDDGTSAPTSPRTEGDSSADYVPERTSFDMNAVDSPRSATSSEKRSTSVNKKHHARSKSGAEEMPTLASMAAAGKSSTSYAAIEGVHPPGSKTNLKVTKPSLHASEKAEKAQAKADRAVERDAAKAAAKDIKDKERAERHKKKDKTSSSHTKDGAHE